MNKISKLAREFAAELQKRADYPTQSTVAPVIKSIIKDCTSQHSELMDGILYASNVNVYQRDDLISVRFILNYLRSKASKVETNKSVRDPVIMGACRQTLQTRFPNHRFDVKWNEAPTDNNWFSKEYD